MRGSDNFADGSLGLGPHLVGKQIDINGRIVSICKQLGEGGFSFVYLVRDKDSGSSEREKGTSSDVISSSRGEAGSGDQPPNSPQHQPRRHLRNPHPLQQQPQHLSSNSSNSSFHYSSQQHQYSQRTQSNNAIPQCNQQQRQPPFGTSMVLKITSVHNSAQRYIAEKEAKLLQRLSHPSIVQVYDHGYRDPTLPVGTTSLVGGGGTIGGIVGMTSSTSHSEENSTRSSSGFANVSSSNSSNNASIASHTSLNQSNLNQAHSSSKPTQHLILMEYCEGGTAFDAIKRMRLSHPSFVNPSSSLSSPLPFPITAVNPPFANPRFDLPSLVISFGQICNAVSYLHAQRPPIIHRDLKPVNFLIKNGAYKLCDFGSAVVGYTDLRTAEQRRKAEELVHKTTTQMFRAPEMVDLYMAKKLTQSTDVWALGCCLYSLAFHRDCFEEGSNLAILSCKYKIPNDNPYGHGLVDLIDRMLTLDYRERADMSEVIMCLSALYSNRPLPMRKKRAGKQKDDVEEETRVGAYRTDGQGIRQVTPVKQKKKNVEAKKLNPNSAAAKRKKASEVQKQKEATPVYQLGLSASTPSNDHLSGNGNSNFSSRPSTSSDFVNFASFDHVFERDFDPFFGDETVGKAAAHSRGSESRWSTGGGWVGKGEDSKESSSDVYLSGQDTNECTSSDQHSDNFLFDDISSNGFPITAAFDKQCQISNQPFLQSSTNFGENEAASNIDHRHAFEVDFQGFENSSSFSSRNYPDSSSNNNKIAVNSLDSINEPDATNGKRKRGLFGILGKR